MASDTAGVVEDGADILDLVHQKGGEISTRMATLTDKISMCQAVLDDLKALKVLVDKSLPDVYVKSQPEPGEPLSKTSP